MPAIGWPGTIEFISTAPWNVPSSETWTGRTLEGTRGVGGTWAVNHPTIQVTTSADRSGVCTYAQGYVSSV